jgi:hypothetical protein
LAVGLALIGRAPAGEMASLPADWNYTRGLELPDARSLALGGVSVAIGSSFGFLANPALAVLSFDRFNAPNLPETKPRPTVGLAGYLGVTSEQRARTVYDFYDNTMGEKVVADNLSTGALPGPIAVQFPIERLGLGLGLAPQYDYSYHYRQETRDDFYQLVDARQLDLSGQVLRLNLTVAYDLLDLVGLGAGFGYDFGARRLDSLAHDSLTVSSQRNLGGMNLAVGLLFHPGNAARVGVTFEPATMKLPGSPDEKSDTTWSDVRNPTRVRLGTSYFSAAKIPSSLYAQISYADWHGQDTTLSSVFELRAGVEHQLLDRMILRYGVGLLPSPVDHTLQTGLVSFGLGFETDLGHIDLGGSLQRRAYDSNWLLPEPGVQMRVYQTGWQVGLSVSRGF